MDSVGDKRDLYRGFAETLSRAVEFAVTPAIFGVGGFFLDRWLGITPVLTLVFSLWALSVMTWRLFHDYSRRMDEELAHLTGGKDAQP